MTLIHNDKCFVNRRGIHIQLNLSGFAGINCAFFETLIHVIPLKTIKIIVRMSHTPHALSGIQETERGHY